MAFTYDIKHDLTGHAPKCGRCGKRIKRTAKGIMRGSKRVFYHPACFKHVKV
jgi:predicted PP-loop superfamily ATPase